MFEIEEITKFGFIKGALPKILEYLGVSSVNDVMAMDFGSEYKLKIKIDRIVKERIGFDGLPYINAFSNERDFKKIGDSSVRDTGILLCETKIINSIFDLDALELTDKFKTDVVKFANIVMTISGGEYNTYENYLIIKKSEAYRLIRHFKKQYSLKLSHTKKPILPDDQLELVLNNSIRFLKKKSELERLGMKVKRGILLMGKPGNGKTMLCNYLRDLCTQSKIEYSVISNSDLKKYLSNGTLEREVADERVTFFDDIEISFLNRKHGGALACTLLSAMDGMHDDNASIKIFTTNESLGEMDEAFYRPGRIDLMIEIKSPTIELRSRYINEFWTAEMLETIKDKDEIVDKTEGFSYADLSQVASICGANYLFNGNWDVDFALEEFDRSRILVSEGEKSGFGFSFKEKKKKSKNE